MAERGPSTGRRLISERLANLFGARLGGAFPDQVRVHALHSAAEAFFAVSLAGSLFFNVSVEAARPRIILYLLLTMAPFAAVAPAIGPLIDRWPRAERFVIAGASAGRAVVAWFLASDLHRLLFYPEAFLILTFGKAYSVAKNALVPSLVPVPDRLVEANSYLSRTGTVASAAGGVTAAGLLNLAGAPWVLRVASVVYLGAGLMALRLPRVDRPSVRSPVLEYEQLHAPRLRLAVWAMASLRAAVGFLIFHLGFVLKRAAEPAWVFAAVFAGAGVGGFAGTLVAPRLRHRFGEHSMLALAVAASASFALVAAWRGGWLVFVALAFGLGVAANVGRHAFDSLVQRDAPAADRVRAFARFETGFQLAWVVGALIAVGTRLPDWAGLALLAALLAAAAAWYMGNLRAAQVIRVSKMKRGVEPGAEVALELLDVAGQSASRSAHGLAVVQAHAAAHAALTRDAARSRSPGFADGAWEELSSLWRRVVVDDTDATAAEAFQALDLARAIVTDTDPPPAAR